MRINRGDNEKSGWVCGKGQRDVKVRRIEYFEGRGKRMWCTWTSGFSFFVCS